MPKSVLESFKPRDHAEAVALFRAEIVGALARRELTHGALHAELVELAARRYRPPGSLSTRKYGASTLERWYYAYQKGGLAALQPDPRSDRGPCRSLPEALRQLLCDIRREHPGASVPLILRTLVDDGRMVHGAVDETTVRRLFRAHGLDRVTLRDSAAPKTRLRWQAERPGALWHADVCHGPPLVVDGHKHPLRIHAILDDASRYIVAIAALPTEREADMLEIFVHSLRRFARPDALYLDNGSTYRGDILRLLCERLGVTLLHAAPYDPQARGKMERFWRTLREGCLDHLGALTSLHDVNVRLYAFLDEHYHKAPHSGLVGRAPGPVWTAALESQSQERVASEMDLRVALTVTQRRRVSRDNVVSIGGALWQTDRGFLAGRVVSIGRCLLDGSEPPWIEQDGKRLPLSPVDPKRNAKTKRQSLAVPPAPSVPFDPPGALRDKWLDPGPSDEEIF
jgi:putative transposase